MRTCPHCERETTAAWCCGWNLAGSQRWRMTRERIRAVHVLARTRKGLDEETYRLQLHAVGVDSSLALNQGQFDRLMRSLRALPDATTKRVKAA